MTRQLELCGLPRQRRPRVNTGRRRRSLPRVEFRRALADWGMGRIHGDEVVALAEAFPVRWGRRWLMLRETDIRPFRELGYERADLAYRWHEGEFDWVAAKYVPRDFVPGSRQVVRLSLRNMFDPDGVHVRSRTFARVASWLDIMALRIQALNVDHELRELLKPGRMVGCSAFDPRAHADRPWPCSVLLADPTLGAHFRGKRGDLVEAWLSEVYSHGNRHGMTLARALCDANLETSWGTVDCPMQALEAAGWIRRGLFEPTWEHHFLHGHEGGSAEVWMREEPAASALGSPNYWPSCKPHPTACAWFPTGHPEALAFLATRAEQ